MERVRTIFQGVGDPRKSNAKKHDLIEMLAVALLATLSGKSSCSSFARYAKVKYKFLKGFLELKGGPPSHDAFSDLSDALDPEQMAAALTEFAAKMLLAALPALLEILDLNGRTVTADAMHTQREASAPVVEKGGDYVFPVKGNQKTLREDVRDWFDDPEARKEMLSCQDVGAGHGRIETRISTVSHDVGWLQDLRSKRRQPT